MNCLCNAVSDLWNSFYTTLFVNIDFRTRNTIGLLLIIASLLFFIKSTKGNKKAEIVNKWSWFWISMICLIIGVTYLTT